MEQNLSWKASGYSSSQEIPSVLWNTKVCMGLKISRTKSPDSLLSPHHQSLTIEGLRFSLSVNDYWNLRGGGGGGDYDCERDTTESRI